MKLYYHPMTRAAKVRWTLEELDLPYELVRMDVEGDDCEKAEYRKVHPLGLLPALEDGGQVLFESAAICLQLADQHPEKTLTPALGTRERGLMYQWILFTSTELEPPLTEIYYQTEGLPEAERVAANLAWGKTSFASRAAVLEQALAGGGYLLGAHFTVADVILGSTLAWAGFMGLLEGYPNLQAYTARCMARPASKRSHEA